MTDAGMDRESPHRIPSDLRGDRTLVCRRQTVTGRTRQVTYQHYFIIGVLDFGG